MKAWEKAHAAYLAHKNNCKVCKIGPNCKLGMNLALDQVDEWVKVHNPSMLKKLGLR